MGEGVLTLLYFDFFNNIFLALPSLRFSNLGFS